MGCRWASISSTRTMAGRCSGSGSRYESRTDAGAMSQPSRAVRWLPGSTYQWNDRIDRLDHDLPGLLVDMVECGRRAWSDLIQKLEECVAQALRALRSTGERRVWTWRLISHCLMLSSAYRRRLRQWAGDRERRASTCLRLMPAWALDETPRTEGKPSTTHLAVCSGVRRGELTVTRPPSRTSSVRYTSAPACSSIEPEDAPARRRCAPASAALGSSPQRRAQSPSEPTTSRNRCCRAARSSRLPGRCQHSRTGRHSAIGQP